MNKKEIDKLIDKYLEGGTTPKEELQLAREVNRPDRPAEWEAIRAMLGTLTLDEAAYDEEMARRRSRSMWTRHIGWAIAASIVVVAGVGLWFNSQQESSTDIAIAYVDGQTITDEDRVLAMAEDAVCDIFSNSDAESSLYEIFNPEE
jgi:ferric-dicitrate binding protein FerR (iron transport regulator)